MNKSLLHIKKVSKTFLSGNKKIQLFKNIDLKINSGDLIALTGPSGSGKSTLLHILALLEKPNFGNVILDKKDINKLTEIEADKVRRDRISIIFQNNNLLTDFTVLENVMMPMHIKDIEIEKAKKLAISTLSDVKLSQRLNHFPSELSGGEQQRVAIARALVADTKIILADEPTGNLDKETSLEIFTYFKRLKRKNKAIIFATHNRELANMADYKLRIYDSKLIRDHGKK